MAPTEGRFAMPERWWDCCCGIPAKVCDRNRLQNCHEWQISLCLLPTDVTCRQRSAMTDVM